jgi:leucyl aminopeptidase
MKHDKTGACTVLAVMDTVQRLAPGTPLLVVAPAVENAIGPRATRPSDVVTALNGKRVEVTNTDAEGRLILGDAMTWAERLGATHLVDVATLTGAAHRALGPFDSALFGSDELLVEELLALGRHAGDRLWHLPLDEDLRADLASPYADLVNSPSRVEGGAIHAALFLREFRTRPWAHLDIAGTAYARTELAWAPRGALGTAHATLVELALAGPGPKPAGDGRPRRTSTPRAKRGGTA